MPFDWQLAGVLRALAWAGLLAVGLYVVARRPDAAGRAFAFWAVVWAGGIQLVLSLQSMATDAATQALLYRVDYYAILLSSSSFLAILVLAPHRGARSGLGLALVLAPGLLAAAWFAADHGAFLVESVQDGAYAVANTPRMQVGYHLAIWTGFLAGMAWLGWRAPRLEPRAQRSATWLMAGLALFAADRFARTWTWWVRDPATLPGGTEGNLYAAFMLLFGPAVLWMVLRAQPLPGGNVALAALLGGAIGGTSIATYAPGDTRVGTTLSALLAPLYGALLGLGVLAAPAEARVGARQDRSAVLAEA